MATVPIAAVARLTGPMNLRLIGQPTVAAILAIRAGLRDARQDRPFFLSTLLRNPAHRRELLHQGWEDVGKVFLIAAILDVIYQLIVHRGVYRLELLLTAVTLAIVPYVLLRGPVTRVPQLNGVIVARRCHHSTVWAESNGIGRLWMARDTPNQCPGVGLPDLNRSLVTRRRYS